MNRGIGFLIVICALILIGNFAALMVYGYALRSTNLFIARSTVFYPLAWLNLVVGISLLAVTLWKIARHKPQ